MSDEPARTGIVDPQARLQAAILDSVDLAFIACDVDGTIRVFNAGATRLLGYSAAEVVGVATPALFHDPTEIAERAATLTATRGQLVEPGFEVFVVVARETRAPDEHEWTYLRKDGSRLPVRLSITAIRDARGEVTGYLGVAHDLTARREAERFAALLMEHSPSAFLLVDVDGKIMSATPRAAELFGYGPTELVGRLVHELVPAAVRAQHVARVASFVRNGHSMRLGTHLEFPGVHRDGRSLYVDLGITPVSLPQGPGVLVSAVDVTARRAQAQRAETQLAVMRHLSRSVDEASAIRTTLTEVATRLGWTWAAFWRLEPSAKRLELAEHWSAQPLLELAQKSRATPLATDAGLPPAAWTPGGAVWKANLSTDASFGRARVARECGMRSLALFRVTVEGELVGAIEFAADAPRARDESVVEMMESIGTALGQFVIRSRAEAALLEARRIGETANER